MPQIIFTTSMIAPELDNNESYCIGPKYDHENKVLNTLDLDVKLFRTSGISISKTHYTLTMYKEYFINRFLHKPIGSQTNFIKKIRLDLFIIFKVQFHS